MATTLTLVTTAPLSSSAAATTSSHVVDIEQGGRISDHRRSTDSDEESDVESRLSSSSGESCTLKTDQLSRRVKNGEQKSRSSSTSSAYSTSSSTCLSECSVEDEAVFLDLESGGDTAAGTAVVEGGKVSVHSSKVEERDCRICHLSLDGSNPESGFPIELGCSCKEDLAAAHKHCAEAWFKIRGNKTCEICGSTAKNVVGVNEVELMEQWNEANDAAATAPVPPHPAETRHFWQGHRFLNFLLACMVFAFVISWLFHFNVPS